MPWELSIIKAKATPAEGHDDVADDLCIPLGSVAEVQAAIEAAHEHTRVCIEPLPEGGTQLIADARTSDETSLVYFGRIDNDKIRRLFVEGRGVGNPFPSLRSLCSPNGWVAYEFTGSCSRLLSLDQDRPPNFEGKHKPLTALVTREDIKSILKQWQTGTLSPVDVMSWAKARHTPDLQVADEEPGSKESVTRDVLGGLELLGINFIFCADIPAYSRFLETPIGEYKNGRDALESHWETVDYRAREEQMKGVWPYDVWADRSKTG